MAIRIDTQHPVSRAIPLRPSLGRTFAVYFMVNDGASGFNSVQLWYRIEGDIAYTLYGTFTSSPIEFITTSDGYHEFYTVARDMAGNNEEHKTTAEAVTKVEAGNDPMTTGEMDDEFGNLRSALDVTMILLAILVFVSITLTAVGTRSVIRGMRSIARRVEDLEGRIRGGQSPRTPSKEPVKPPAQPPVLKVEPAKGMKSEEDFEAEIEDEIGAEES